jgi:hypothetical protein
MKKLIFLLFFPILVFSQSERAQKAQVRSFGTYGPSSSSQFRSESFSRPSNNEAQQKITERNRRSEYYTPQNTRPGRYYSYDPYWDWGWGWNRWSPMWGWNSFTPFFWYDSWGYRNPARVYIYDDGKRDTIKLKPLHGSIGVSYNMNSELGVWGTLGREVYVIAEFSKNNPKDISVFYPELTLDKVLPWEDRKLSNFQQQSTFSIGLGKKLNKFAGIHMMVGFGREKNNFRYYDDYFILSNNGEYSFPNYRINKTTFKIGTLLNLSNKFNSKIDYDLSEGYISWGLGVKL